MGRIIANKGCGIFVELAKRFPNVEFVLCGQGDPKPYLSEPNITYKAPIHGKERGEYLGSLTASICMSKFLEPFNAVAVESQLCGTPVISSDSGGMVETVEHFKTGLRVIPWRICALEFKWHWMESLIDNIFVIAQYVYMICTMLRHNTNMCIKRYWR